MDWISGMQKAIDYMEEHLTEEISMEAVAAQSFSSSYHFQRVFTILCGFSVGEYLRNRRLSLAGTELATTDQKVIDIALKYGYESPDSYAKAFHRFHGILPSQARDRQQQLKSFSRLVLKISLEGGSIMNYRIENKPEMVLVGYKRRYTGTPAERVQQEGDFYIATRPNQYILKGLPHDCDTTYNVMTNFGEDGYDFYIAGQYEGDWKKELDACDTDRFETIVIPAGQYVICETDKSRYPTMEFEGVRKKMISEWLPSSGYELAEAPELSVYHWFYEKGNDAVNHSRYIELWIPVTKA